MSRLYLDTEFNGFGGELVSLALVADDGREYYAVLPEPRVWDPWVVLNVVPVLSAAKPVTYPQTREEFRRGIEAFLRQFDNPIIVADWYTDLVHFFSIFGGRDHTQSIAFACRAELVLLDDIASEVPHNALADARAIRAALMADPSSTEPQS